jgi:predicted nucleic acid-binding protein
VKILVDTNVLLDVGLSRPGFAGEGEAVFRWSAVHPGDAFIAWHSLSNVYYILRKQEGKERAREFVAILLDIFEVPGAGTSAAKSALRLQIDDFEDALQVASASQAGVDVIVTRDAQDYAGSLVPSQAPAEFLALMGLRGST